MALPTCLIGVDMAFLESSARLPQRFATNVDAPGLHVLSVSLLCA